MQERIHRTVTEGIARRLALGACLLLSACAATPRTGGEQSPPLNAQTPVIPDGASPVMKAVDLFGDASVKRAYEFTLGKLAGQKLPHRRSILPDGKIIDLLEGHQSAEFVVDDAVSLLAEDDYTSKVRVVYDPPMTILPAMLRAGETTEQLSESAMTVTNLADGSPRDKGRCKYKVELLGRDNVVTPAGSFDAWIVRTTRHLTLQMASGTVVTHSAYVEGRGLIAEHVEQNLKMLGLIAIKSEDEFRLAR